MSKTDIRLVTKATDTSAIDLDENAVVFNTLDTAPDLVTFVKIGERTPVVWHCSVA